MWLGGTVMAVLSGVTDGLLLLIAFAGITGVASVLRGKVV
jgi:hypothetical protein